MKIVVDSNIVFSAILNAQSNIGQLLINGSKYFDFFTIGLLKDEIINHREKILRIAGFTEPQFTDTFLLIIKNIKLVDDVLLSDEDIDQAINLVSDIDENDAMFIALNIHLSSILWTGDKRLINGLKKKSYSKIVTTDELHQIFLDKELKNRMKGK
jgi:predicted nucleic acid-binding protein